MTKAEYEQELRHLTVIYNRSLNEATNTDSASIELLFTNQAERIYKQIQKLKKLKVKGKKK